MIITCFILKFIRKLRDFEMSLKDLINAKHYKEEQGMLTRAKGCQGTTWNATEHHGNAQKAKEGKVTPRNAKRHKR